MFDILSKWINRKIKYIFTAPVIIFLLIMVIFPVIFALQVSFTNRNPLNLNDNSFVGFKNYLYILKDSRVIYASLRTIYFTFITVSIETITGVAIALFLNREFKGKNLVKTLFLLPMVATPVAVSQVWGLIYEPILGTANYVLKSLHLPAQSWLASSQLVLPSLMVIDIWQWTPFVILIVIAGLSALPVEPFEAASIDGAGTWQIIKKITLPLLRPTIIVAILIRMVDSLKTFDIIYSLTAGGPGTHSETLYIYTYIITFGYSELSKGTALAIMLLLLIAIISLFLIMFTRKREVEY